MYKIDSRKIETALVVIVEGYCNQEAGDEIIQFVQQQFETGKAKNLIFNYFNCTGINSPGVARVLEATEIVTEDFAGQVYICGLDKVKTSFFEMVGILELAEIAKDESTAVKMISGDAA